MLNVKFRARSQKTAVQYIITLDFLKEGLKMEGNLRITSSLAGHLTKKDSFCTSAGRPAFNSLERADIHMLNL